MPITRRQFELDIDPKIEEIMRSLHGFLTAHKEEAFAFSELLQELAREGKLPWGQANTFAGDLELALDELLELGAAEKRKVRGLDYYSYGQHPLEI